MLFGEISRLLLRAQLTVSGYDHHINTIPDSLLQNQNRQFASRSTTFLRQALQQSSSKPYMLSRRTLSSVPTPLPTSGRAATTDP
jgi:hypothetical protein